MNKLIAVCFGIVVLFLGCTSENQFNKVFAGSMLGGVFGSSIGGLMEGPRGSDAGNIIGMVVGGTVGAAVANQQNKEYTYPENSDVNLYNRHVGSESTPSYLNRAKIAIENEYKNLNVENLRFSDNNNNHKIDAGEHCKIIFELHNYGANTLYDIAPIIGVKGSKRIIISPTAIIASIGPNQGVRYTAEIYGRPNLRTGSVEFSLGFAKEKIVYNVKTFKLLTFGRQH